MTNGFVRAPTLVNPMKGVHKVFFYYYFFCLIFVFKKKIIIINRTNRGPPRAVGPRYSDEPGSLGRSGEKQVHHYSLF